jgi:hypothetical protein
MLHKFILRLGLLAITTVTISNASSAEINSPAQLAKQQESLSKKLISSYIKHEDISQTLDNLKEKQDRLKSKVQDPEIKNLLDFLNICLKDIKLIETKPRNHSNVQRIADLSTSISEGSRYIANALR